MRGFKTDSRDATLHALADNANDMRRTVSNRSADLRQCPVQDYSHLSSETGRLKKMLFWSSR